MKSIGIFILFAISMFVLSPAMAKECLDCHSDTLSQMKSGSHHIQGTAISGKHCYACHWEATAAGKINPKYHGVMRKKSYGTSTVQVDLVLWEKGVRPARYKDGSSAVIYRYPVAPSSERSEVAKITRHCLGCHSDGNNDMQPFAGDSRTPRSYAWDRQSIASRYSNKEITTWGKYSTAATNKKKRIIKAFSAHGNAARNQGGWNASGGYDGDMPLTRGGSRAKNIECFDCHNSHGSKLSGITSSYRTFDGTFNGGIIKQTFSGKGGYRITYSPSVNSDFTSENPYNSGAGLCFDCHESATSGATPWGYSSTFGATEPVMGYKDSMRFSSGAKGSALRYESRQSRSEIASSHLKAGLFLNYSAQGKIYGLCTPCHDPHGISKTLGANMQYAVPLLKGAWLTSPYREDGPPAVSPQKWIGIKRESGSSGSGGGSAREPMSMPGMKYNVDRNTFGNGNRIEENADTFGGICLKCHAGIKSDGVSKSGQIHRAVKGWGNNKEHSFPCSKCHQPHNSGLPRLMQTNCFEQGPSGLRENSGLPWLPDKKDESVSSAQKNQQSDAVLVKNKKPAKGSLVGCHVRQFGKR